MAVFGFDIDDTVADGNTYFVKGLNEFLGKNIKAEEVRGRLCTTYGVEQSILDEYFYNLGEKLFTDLDPINGAAESINKLYDAGHTIIFITARPETANDSTKYWLNKYGFKYHKLFHSATKTELCSDLGIQVFVDDHPTIVETMNEINVQAVFVDCSKNKDIETHESIHRAENWKDIYDFIVRWDRINNSVE